MTQRGAGGPPESSSRSHRDILVRGPRRGLPFSKGLLSQSLLASAIDPSEAFEVAREIEDELVASGTREIDRNDLRAIAHRVLLRRSGDRAAERYLLWRSYEEPDVPVIVMLGGTSGVGKTSLALEVARRLGIGRALSTDSIRQVMRIMVAPGLIPAIHGSSYDAHLLLPREPGAEPTVIDGFRAQASAVSIGIRGCLDRAAEESANLVLDGVSLVPGMVDVESFRDRARVISLIVATIDEAALRERFRARAIGQKRRLPHRYLDNFDGILAIQRYLVRQAERHRFPVIDNVDFDDSVRQILCHVLDTLRGTDEEAASGTPSSVLPT
jgi:2-phosphoglycerate kinase